MLVTCATWNYRHLLQPLLASHQATNATNPLHVHAIEWPADERLAAAAAFPHAVFHHCENTIGDTPLEMLGPVPRSASILKLKVQLLHQHYQQSSTSVIWVDADTLLLDSIDALLTRIEATGDFAVTYRANKRKHAKFAVAVLCFTRSNAAAKLLDAYLAGTEASSGLVKRSSSDGVAWFHDQLALWNAFRAHSQNRIGWPRKNAPTLVPLTDQEHSIDGSTNAIFVSRRDGVLDLNHMHELLKARGIATPSWPDTTGGAA